MDYLCEEVCRSRRQIRRLEDDGVAVSECRGDLPGRDGDRKIPGGYEPDYAYWFAKYFDIDIGPDRSECLARYAQGLTRVVTECL